MTGAPGPESPTATISPTSPTSTFVTPSGDCVIDIDGEKVDDAVENVETNEKNEVIAVGRSQLNAAPMVPTELTHVDLKEGNFQRRLTDLTKRLTSSIRPPLVLSRHRQSDGTPKLIQRIDDHPQGYPQLAAFVNSDENFMICRKYGFLRTRVLLYRQDELRQMERDLLEADEEDAIECPLALQSRKTDEGREQDAFSRKSLIERIDAKLKQYDSAVNQVRAFMSISAPTPRNLKSFVTWMQNEAPLTQEESDFLEQQDDFMSLASGQEAGWLDGKIEDALKYCLPKHTREVPYNVRALQLNKEFTIPSHLLTPIKRLLTSKDQICKSNDPYVHLISKYRIDLIVRLVLTLTTVGLLIGPSAVLYTISGHGPLKITIVMLFTLLFSVAVSLFTKARRHEMLAASAT